MVPVRPSPSDLWAVAAVGLLKQIGTPFLFVLNQATLNANITAQAVVGSCRLTGYGTQSTMIAPSGSRIEPPGIRPR